MNDDFFWQFVADCGGSPAAKADDFLNAWKAALRRQTPEVLVGLNAALARNLRRAYTWGVRGVAYIVDGGCTDDDFLYFRQWLVSRGRSVFEAGIENADELANLIPPDIHGPLAISELDLSLGDVWEEKTGIDQFDPQNGFPNEEVDLEKILGHEWNEDVKSMARRFPKCWARFVELTANT